MGSRRPNRYAGSRSSIVLHLTRLGRVDKRRQKKIQTLDKQLSAFKLEPYGYLKIRKVYNMYAKLDVLDDVSVEWYPKFEEQLPEKVRPSSVVGKTTTDCIEVDLDRSISLKSLIVAFGPKAAPLVKFALKHNLTDKMKFFVTPGDPVNNCRTCNVVSVDYKWQCSLGNVPMLAIATAVANENGEVYLYGLEGVEFTDPDKVNMIEYFKYRYPNTLKEVK